MWSVISCCLYTLVINLLSQLVLSAALMWAGEMYQMSLTSAQKVTRFVARFIFAIKSLKRFKKSPNLVTKSFVGNTVHHWAGYDLCTKIHRSYSYRDLASQIVSLTNEYNLLLLLLKMHKHFFHQVRYEKFIWLNVSLEITSIHLINASRFETLCFYVSGRMKNCPLGGEQSKHPDFRIKNSVQGF